MFPCQLTICKSNCFFHISLVFFLHLYHVSYYHKYDYFLLVSIAKIFLIFNYNVSVKIKLIQHEHLSKETLVKTTKFHIVDYLKQWIESYLEYLTKEHNRSLVMVHLCNMSKCHNGCYAHTKLSFYQLNWSFYLATMEILEYDYNSLQYFRKIYLWKDLQPLQIIK